MAGSHGHLTAESLAAQLEKPKRSGAGWMACCPSHDDSTPSLKIDDGESGKLLLRCHGGCDQRAVLDALEARGIRLNGQTAPMAAARARTTPKQAAKPTAIMPVPEGAEAEFQAPAGAQHRFDFRDLDGRLHFIVTREDIPKALDSSGGKDHYKRPLPWIYTAQGWLNLAPPHGRIPLGLPDLVNSPPARRVIIVQGELKRDVLQEWLKCQKRPNAVITSMGGDGSVLLTDWTALKARKVAIWPDNDVKGREAAQRLAAHLHAVGCPSIRVLEPPSELGPSEDVHDLIKRDRLSNELLNAMFKAAPEWTAPAEPPAESHTTDTEYGAEDATPSLGPGADEAPTTLHRAIHRFKDAADLLREPEPVEWLWQDCLPDRETSLLFGTGKAGKSTFAQELACHVAAGESFLGAEVRAGRVLYVAAEDSIGRVRNAIRAYVTRALAQGWLSADAPESIARNLMLLEAAGNRFKLLRYLDGAALISAEVGSLIEIMKGHPGPWSLGIFDTAARLSDGEENNRDFALLVDAADHFSATGAASLIVHHSGKGASRAHEVGMDAARGGTALVYGARSVLQLIHVPENSDEATRSLIDREVAVPAREVVASEPIDGLPKTASRALVGLLHVACNAGPTSRPRWMIRHDWLGYPVLHPLEFHDSIEAAREARRAEQQAEKLRQQEQERFEFSNVVVEAVRRITTGKAGNNRIATVKHIRTTAGIGERKVDIGIAWALGGARIEEYEEMARNNRPCTAYRLAATDTKEAAR